MTMGDLRISNRFKRRMMHKMKQIDVLKEDDKAGDGSMEETI
ncbi:unnamed protein product [Rhodiola kirilowii]